jgi:hypothetical protein
VILLKTQRYQRNRLMINWVTIMKTLFLLWMKQMMTLHETRLGCSRLIILKRICLLKSSRVREIFRKQGRLSISVHEIGEDVSEENIVLFMSTLTTAFHTKRILILIMKWPFHRRLVINWLMVCDNSRWRFWTFA